MKLSITLTGVDQFAARHPQVAADLEVELVQALRDQAEETRDAWRDAAPTFTGALRRGIRARTDPRRLTARVLVAPHGHLVQHGRRPGRMPAVDPARAASPKSAQRLRDFAAARGIDPFVLARAIARKGTRPHPFRSIGTAKEAFEARIQAAVARVMAKYRSS